MDEPVLDPALEAAGEGPSSAGPDGYFDPALTSVIEHKAAGSVQGGTGPSPSPYPRYQHHPYRRPENTNGSSNGSNGQYQHQQQSQLSQSHTQQQQQQRSAPSGQDGRPVFSIPFPKSEGLLSAPEDGTQMERQSSQVSNGGSAGDMDMGGQTWQRW